MSINSYNIYSWISVAENKNELENQDFKNLINSIDKFQTFTDLDTFLEENFQIKISSIKQKVHSSIYVSVKENDLNTIVNFTSNNEDYTYYFRKRS